MNYFCCDRRRRNLLKGSALNGIDFVEVLDHDAPNESERQRTLFLHLINDPVSALNETNIRIDGGERISGIVVESVTPGSGAEANVLTVKLNKYGDFSIYTLRIVQTLEQSDPPSGFDRLFSAVDFSFKVECPSDFDCRPRRICPPERPLQPELDYLAKDYASFRRLMLDRMSALMPQWQERNAADLGIALVELLAYAGDHLSYQQDAVATEAYLGTARRRVSVRRHARLVDYLMHDGGNARAWVQVRVEGADHVALSRGTPLLSRLDQQPRRIGSADFVNALRQKPVVFETMHDALLFEAHNNLQFYTWSDEQCCLPKGATRATLLDSKSRLRLRPGDVLIFEERIGPKTGLEADADPAHRHAVRLTSVNPEATSVLDADGKEINRTAAAVLHDDLPTPPQAIVEIEWAAEDALPFAFCISAITDKEHGAELKEDVSVAHGNIVLADHGLTVAGEQFDKVPAPEISRPQTTADDRCAERDPIAVPARFRPSLHQSPLTHAAPLQWPPPSARAASHWTTRDLLPAITLESLLDDKKQIWKAQHDLLGSESDATDFVVEIESDGAAFLRFGDDARGARPVEDTTFTAQYRVGNGVAGNIGAEALWHIVANDSAFTGLRNPMPAQGGIEPESMEDARQRAPSAFRTQERAVTETDYAEVTERDAEVQRAAATFRWTGSWHTVFLTIDRVAGLTVDEDFEEEITTHVNRFRMAGHDLEVDAPHFVSLEIEMHVCVSPDYFRSSVKAALLELFSNRVLPDGRRGFFHPDNFTFGQSVYLSRVYAAAQSVTGVTSVHITKFKRQNSDDESPLENGFLKLGRLEIARLDNDPNFAERGVFTLTLGGGK